MTSKHPTTPEEALAQQQGSWPQELIKPAPKQVTDMIEKIKGPDVKAMNFAQKKNYARFLLSERGVLAKGGKNTFDNYKYFSEAQYKELFVGLFSQARLEFMCTVIKVEDIPGTPKMPFGRRVTLRCELTDIDSTVANEAIGEDSEWVGEAFDKGDKAIYKAYTGALKYYFANTFHVATGDDPEKDDRKPEEQEAEAPQLILPWQMKVFHDIMPIAADMEKFLQRAGLAHLEDMTYEDAANKLEVLKEWKKKKEQNDGGASQ
jgi:hypothetical protein